MWSARPSALASFLLWICRACPVAGVAERGSSLEKLVEMLEKMINEGEAEMQKNEVQFAKYKLWWEGAEKTLKASIADAESNEEALDASVKKLQNEVEQLGQQIDETHAKKVDTEKTSEAATVKREAEHKDFLAQEMESRESLETLDKAITVLEKEPSKVNQADILLQLSQKQHLSADTQAAFKAFLESTDDDSNEERGSPDPVAYENQSRGLIIMLTSMREKVRKMLKDSQIEEANKKQAYDLLIGDLTNELAVLDRTTEDLSSEKASKTEKEAADDKELTSTADSRKADQESLKEGSATWDKKKNAFDANQKTRQDELTAINQAKSVLEGQEVSAGKKHLKLMQAAPVAMALVHLRESSASWSARVHVQDFIAKRADELHSRNLMLLASKLAADPFVKVKGLIQDMIEKLSTEADKDADKNAFCETELGKSKVTRTDLSEKIEGLTAKVDNLKSEITMSEEAISKLTTEVSELQSDKDVSVKQWTEEEANLNSTMAEAKMAKESTASALKTLKDFYTNASESSQSYKGSDASASVMALFEVIHSDFAKLEADSKASLASGAHEHQDMIHEFDKNIAVKTKSIEMNKASKLDAEVALGEFEKDLKSRVEKLEAKDKYHEELVQDCFEKGDTYEDKAKAREDEIEALKQAVRLLSN